MYPVLVVVAPAPKPKDCVFGAVFPNPYPAVVFGVPNANPVAGAVFAGVPKFKVGAGLPKFNPAG